MSALKSKKSKEELEKIFSPLCYYPLSFVSVNTVNFKPHPYTIGPKHINYASDHCGGILGEDVCKKVPCAHSDRYSSCKLSYDQHTYDTVLFLSLTRNVTEEEVKEVLNPKFGNFMEENGLDGVAFLETPQKYRITNDEKEQKEQKEQV